MRHRLPTAVLPLILGLFVSAAHADSVPAPDVAVTLTEAGGEWTVTFSFAEVQRAVVFKHAPEPYRSGEWQSLTPGVSVERIGQADVMVFDRERTSATFRIEPRTTSLMKAYTPFLQFADGNWGILEGQFRVAPAESLAEVEDFGGNGESWPGAALTHSLALHTGQRVHYAGSPAVVPLVLRPSGDGRYIHLGAGEAVSGENFVGFVDRGLPDWLEERLDRDLSAIFGELSAEFGLDLPQRAEIFFVFDGTSEPGLQQTGGAIGNQLALQVSGEALLEPDPTIADFFKWFLAHESAHLFQIAAGMGDVPQRHAWLHEGAANAMAHRIGGRLASDREAFLAEVYAAAFRDCTAYLAEGRPLAAAIEVGRYDAYYACGDFIALVTEAEMAEGDIFDFWRGFLKRAREERGGAISAPLYLDHALASGMEPETAKWLRAFVSEPVEDPASVLVAALEKAGLSPVLGEDGGLTALKLPA